MFLKMTPSNLKNLKHYKKASNLKFQENKPPLVDILIIEPSLVHRLGKDALRFWFHLCVCVWVSLTLWHIFSVKFFVSYLLIVVSVGKYIIGGPTTTNGMYRYIWVLVCMGLYGNIQVCIGMNEYIWICITIYGYVWLYMNMQGYVRLYMPYMSKKGYLWVYMGELGYIKIYMGIEGYVWLYMGTYQYFWACMGLYGYIQLFVRIYWSVQL